MNFDVMQADNSFVAGTYKRFPIVITSGEGSLLFDESGKSYIDMGTGIGVNIFGIGDEVWKAAVIEQLDKIQHASNLYYTEPQAKLAKLLAERTGMKKVFYANSGAEVNENGIKAVRGYAAKHKGRDYYTIITLRQSFHGRTLTTLAATGQDKFHELFQPLTEGFIHVEPDDSDALKEAVRTHKIAGIMIECVQGEGGVRALSEAFVSDIADICRKEDIVLMCDEVQCGNGRSGYLYAYMHYGIEPDVVTTAKGLGGGLPIGAVMLGEKVQDVFGPGDTGSTFGGNPVATAGAVSILERIDETLLSEVKAKGEYIFDAFSGAPGIKSVSGMGLMVGLETERPADEVIAALIDRGVLVLSASGRIRLLPALNIPWELLRKAIDQIKEVCRG